VQYCNTVATCGPKNPTSYLIEDKQGEVIKINADPSHKNKDPHLFANLWMVFTTFEMIVWLRLPALQARARVPTIPSFTLAF
jgi:hypothetical protein